MELKRGEEDGVAVLGLSGRLDAEQAELLKHEFQKIIQPKLKIVFDLENLEYLDSTGLGMLVHCLKTCREEGGRLVLARLGNRPRMLFELTRANRIFEIHDDLSAALAALRPAVGD